MEENSTNGDIPIHPEGGYPATNAIRAQMDEDPKFPEDVETRKYIILFPEDYEKFGNDMDGNLALLVNREQATEIERLARKIRLDLEESERTGDEDD